MKVNVRHIKYQIKYNENNLNGAQSFTIISRFKLKKHTVCSMTVKTLLKPAVTLIYWLYSISASLL